MSRPLDGYGYVSPRAEVGPIVACTWTSNKFPEAREELARLFDLTMEPSLTRVYRWPRGMPQYHVGHRARLDRIDRLATRLPGLLLAGSAYRGVGLPDCITQGWAAADRALRVLRAAA